ncbi:putative membrane protein [Ruminococcus sp. CAG:563]|nr:putative membrane protein [Ruminococcus sp. CAG:563]
MSLIGTKKTLNFHKYSLKATEIMSNWKLFLPIIFTFAGIISGCFGGKGEGKLYLKITDYFTTVILTRDITSIGSEFLIYLIFPAVFLIVIFFLGLSVFGALITNVMPLIYGYIIGCISFFLYNEYTLKGLGYCIIMIFPYGTLCLLAIVLCCRESINMSEYIMKSISKTTKFPNYGFAVYYKSFFRNLIFIVGASALKTILEYLFGGLFAF